ncbi:hypothetical protein BXZ70DRAFT_422562 [Cristinia sonorae]|uniref:Nuclear GTPase SLIP-GC n=1 Tax=Cristinia sonorae TaxID=1940300 RepID=A0A8K0XU45_9AGAR|nr:hypothetical protein BXZ70DRAFT_422562 [Cristinia sonorae]
MNSKHKENTMSMGQSSSQTRPYIKPEPQEVHIGNPLGGSSHATEAKPEVKRPRNNVLVPKSEPGVEDVVMYHAPARVAPAPPATATYKKFGSPYEIDYAPEGALKEGLNMVKVLNTSIKKLDIGSKLRKDVWMREVEALQSQAAPSTMIAVCGATGAGKSSILNAILDDNIVPTSGMRACTAVVTEIAYHNKRTIEGDVSFLSEKEWRDELSVLLDDLVDEDGNLKRSTDLRSDAGIAWSKVHAVYPTVTQEKLVRMTVDQIIGLDPRIAGILGTTKRISANDSKTFAKEIGKYIDSKDQKRGDKKKDKKTKEKQKDKSKGASILEKFRQDLTARTKAANKDPSDDPNGPAFWPLIRQVNVRCNAAALSTGAILVDLPGVADANAARNNIAKDYMKKCDCIWILAPITRAVDDKTARDLMGDAFKMQLMMDGNYDDHAITFIATKCDDISCSEVIRALNLDDDPELEVIEDQLETCKAEIGECKEKKAAAEASAKEIDQSLKTIRPIMQEYKAHLQALKDGEEFTPTLTGKQRKKKRTRSSSPDSDGESSPGQKRKRSGGKERSSKRRKSGPMGDDDDDFIDDEDDEELQFSDEDETDKESTKESDDESDGDKSESETDDDEDDAEEDDDEDEEMDEEATEESLKGKIAETDAALKEGRVQLSEQRRLRKDAVDQLASLKKKQDHLQREKNAFCSLKRSEFSRDVLKEDFRVGLKELDDAAAEERDPDSFDPTVNLRNYDAIDLPVFTCSSRDYVRLKGQVKGDGEPACFSRIEDTGIPEIQKWCHNLTVASRERAARNFLTHLKTFANSVRTYVQGIGDVTAADREALREKWESSMPEDDGPHWDHDDPVDLVLPGLNLSGMANQILNSGLYRMVEKAPKVDRYGEPIGITPRLIKDFKRVVDDCVDQLQHTFRDGLEEKCQVGAANAANAAVETSDTFAASMHWGTYRATLRRHGSWRRDLNVELSNPFTRQIASSWSKVFETDLFAPFEKAANIVIIKLLKEVEASAALGLKERASGQGELSLEEAKVALRKTLDVVRDTINTEQKEVSRCLAPHVQGQLVDGYDRAMEERGRGSVARQKVVFHDYVSSIKHMVFEDAADVIMDRLSKAAEAVGLALHEALAELAEKIEVSIAVLWEGTRDDPSQMRVRQEVINAVTDITEQVQHWTLAAQLKNAAATAL